MAFTDITDLLITLKTEDTSFYLELINKTNKDKMDNYQVKDYLTQLNATDVNKLTDTQLVLLKNIGFTWGNRVWFYSNQPITVLESRWVAVQNRDWNFFNNLKDLPEDDLKYLSNYHRNKWKKSNGSTSTRVIKGITYNFSMDEFSLAAFKGAIKPFNRNEGKNIILRVNKAYNESSRTAKEISIRNRFYKLILDNTAHHTKAMVNSLIETPLISKDYKYYQPREDETIAILISRWDYSKLQAYSNIDSIDSYSNDLTIATDCKTKSDDRVINRTATAASTLVSLHVETGNDVYLALAKRMLDNIPDKQEIINKTKSAMILHNLVKELK